MLKCRNEEVRTYETPSPTSRLIGADVDIADLDAALGTDMASLEAKLEADRQREEQEAEAKAREVLLALEAKKAQRIAKMKATNARKAEEKRIQEMRRSLLYRFGDRVNTMPVDELEKLVELKKAYEDNHENEKSMRDEVSEYIPLCETLGIRATYSLTGDLCLKLVGAYCTRYGSQLNPEYITSTRYELDGVTIGLMDFRVPAVKTPEELSKRLWL